MYNLNGENDESDKSDEKRAFAKNKINYKLWANTVNKRNRNNEPKVEDQAYKRCMTRTARNTIEESGEDGQLKQDDCNVAMEMHN